MARITITNNARRPATHRARPGVRTKAVPGTSSSQNKRPVGDVRADPRFVKPGGGGPATRTIAKRTT
jgi:hypothetical protein